jgi:hypothetical protein
MSQHIPLCHADLQVPKYMGSSFTTSKQKYNKTGNVRIT